MQSRACLCILVISLQRPAAASWLTPGLKQASQHGGSSSSAPAVLHVLEVFVARAALAVEDLLKRASLLRAHLCSSRSGLQVLH